MFEWLMLAGIMEEQDRVDDLEEKVESLKEVVKKLAKCVAYQELVRRGYINEEIQDSENNY